MRSSLRRNTNQSELVDQVFGKGIGRVKADIQFSSIGSKPKIKEL